MLFLYVSGTQTLQELPISCLQLTLLLHKASLASSLSKPQARCANDILVDLLSVAIYLHMAVVLSISAKPLEA